jgi:hypothetical protein
MVSFLENSFWDLSSSFPPNVADVQVLADRAFVSKNSWPSLKITTSELSAVKFNSLPLDILWQKLDSDCAVRVSTHFMPNHPNGFAPDTYVCMSCCPDGQTRVGGNVARRCSSECSALELWAASLAGELMKCRLSLVGTFERLFWAVENQGDETP